MFKKVLVVEDIDSINIGLTKTLGEAFDFDIDHAKFCDKASLKITKALLDKEPYDLLITDLSFKSNGQEGKIQNGEDLIREVRAKQPKLKTIIYSIEDRPFKLKEFITDLKVDGYVLKGRNSSREMVEAIKEVAAGTLYVSQDIMQSIHTSPTLEIDDFDLELLKELADGFSQQEISKHFQTRGITPASLSSIEKRINRLKDYFMARNTTHLVALAKDMGLM